MSLSTLRKAAALTGAGAIVATGLLGAAAPNADAGVRYGTTPDGVRYGATLTTDGPIVKPGGKTTAASSARITHYSNSISTIQVAPCNRAKSSCSITAVLSPGQTGPKGSYWMYIQSGKKGLRIGAPAGTPAKPGGKWVDGRVYGVLGGTYKVVNA